MKRRKSIYFAVVSFVMAFVLMAAPMFCGSFFLTEESGKVRAAESGEADLSEGIYSIEGKLLDSQASEIFVAGGAVEKTMKLTVEDGKATLRMNLVPFTGKVGEEDNVTSFEGYLAAFNYFSDWTGGSNGYQLPTEEKAMAAVVESSYEEYDDYNDPQTGGDEEVKGKLYPKEIAISLTLPTAFADEDKKLVEIWVQVYVPALEKIETGSGWQYARLQLDWTTVEKTGDLSTDSTDAAASTAASDATTATESEEEEKVDKTSLYMLMLSASSMTGRENVYTAATLKKLKSAVSKAQDVFADEDATQKEVNAQATALAKAILNLKEKTQSSSSSGTSSGSSSSTSTSSTSESLDIKNLEDGVYSLKGKMYKIDKETLSMSNDAISHKIKLTVKNGKYYLTMDFKGLQVGTQYGYLGKLKYYASGYKLDSYNSPTGTLKKVTVNSYQKDSDGKKVKDTYGTNYPDKVTFPMISEAKDDGWAPLQVFVPIMDAISAGSGTQNVWLKLDLSSLTEGSSSSSEDDDSSSSTSSNSASSSSSGSTAGSSKLTSGSTLPSSSSATSSKKTTTGTSGSSQTALEAGTDESAASADGSEDAAAAQNTENSDDSDEEPGSIASVIPAFMSVLAVLAGGIYKAWSRRLFG